METKEYLQINILKGFAIVCVVILHSYAGQHLIHHFIISGLHTFLINQCVWIFYVIMGLVMGLSLRRNNAITLNELYSKKYFKNRINRVIYPFLFCFLIVIILGLLFYDIYHFERHEGLFYFGNLNFLGRFPTGGAGNYYVLIVFQFTLFFPLIYRLYLKNQKWTIIGSFIVSFMFEILFDLHYSIGYSNWELAFLYSGSILRGLPAFVLGLWISYEYEKGNLRSFIQNNKFIIAGFLFSFIYLMLYWLIEFKFEYFESYWGFRNMFQTFYPFILVLLGIEYLPEKSKKKITNLIATLGRASYHIFLIQMIYLKFFKMGMQNMNSLEFGTPMYVLFWWILFSVNIINSILCGLAFYYADKKIRHLIRKRSIKKVPKEFDKESKAYITILFEKKCLESLEESKFIPNHQLKQLAKIS